MRQANPRGLTSTLALIAILLLNLLLATSARAATAPDKLIGVNSSRVMSQSFPWVAEEAGIFKKYNLDHRRLSSRRRCWLARRK